MMIKRYIMKIKGCKICLITGLVALSSCSQYNRTASKNDPNLSSSETESMHVPSHRYGGWYCPDNLNGFAPVDIKKWKQVPVINGRMPTKEETQNGSSLIFVDLAKYPNAKPLNISVPKLASFYNQSSKRYELVIIIQAINVDHDSIVGFRYLNGGNGSARLSEVKILSDSEISKIPNSQFITQTVGIHANAIDVWNVLTQYTYSKVLQGFFDSDNTLPEDWRIHSNVNYHYANAGKVTASYADMLYGSYYIQNDYDNLHYNEKFLILESQDTSMVELKIVTGPYGNDYKAQEQIINGWVQKVKELSEQHK